MLMAAGLGTRLRPFSELEAKPLLPILGVPTAQFIVDALVNAGVSSIVANIHHLPDKTAAGLRALELGSSTLVLSDERALLLGSAGGIKKAEAALGSRPFYLANGDVLCDVDWEALGYAHSRLRRQWGVSLTLAIHPQGPGGELYREVMLDKKTGLIRGLGEKANGKPFYSGVAVIEPEALGGLSAGEPSEFVPKVLQPAIEAGKAGFFLMNGPWLDVGSPALWLNTHCELLRCLETGQGLSPRWRRLIERRSRRIGQELWVSSSAPGVTCSVDWSGPAYWYAENHETAPDRLGPRAVLYGEAPVKQHGHRAGELSNGIGYQRIWVKA